MVYMATQKWLTQIYKNARIRFLLAMFLFSRAILFFKRDTACFTDTVASFLDVGLSTSHGFLLPLLHRNGVYFLDKIYYHIRLLRS